MADFLFPIVLGAIFPPPDTTSGVECQRYAQEKEKRGSQSCSESDRTGKESRDTPHWGKLWLGIASAVIAISGRDYEWIEVIDLLKEMHISPNIAAAVFIHQPRSEIIDCSERLVL
jgi:hypothetical protein